MSTYFKYFPKISYTIKPSKASGEAIQTANIPDIFGGYTLPDRYKNNPNYFYMYTIADGETPNNVSFKLYGTEEYAWILLLLNDISDCTTQWPLSTSQLESYVDEKYQTDLGGQALFLTVNFSESINNFDTFVRGATIFPYSTSSASVLGLQEAFVWDWNPTYRRLILTEGYTGNEAGDLVYTYYSSSSTTAFTVNGSVGYLFGVIVAGATDNIIIPQDLRSPVDDFFVGMNVTFNTSGNSTIPSSDTLTIIKYESGTGRITFSPSITDGYIPTPSGIIEDVVCQSNDTQLPVRDLFTITTSDGLAKSYTLNTSLIGRLVSSVKDSLAYFSADTTDNDSPALSPYSHSSTAGLLDQYITQGQLVASKVVTFMQMENNLNEAKRKIKVLKAQYVQEVIGTISAYFKGSV